MITKIVSGGQTGADRAALDFALENAITVTGFVPLGRQAEDGTIDKKYPNLTETDSSYTADRTRLNIHLADATVIFSHGPLSSGSKYTFEYAFEMGIR